MPPNRDPNPLQPAEADPLPEPAPPASEVNSLTCLVDVIFLFRANMLFGHVGMAYVTVLSICIISIAPSNLTFLGCLILILVTSLTIRDHTHSRHLNRPEFKSSDPDYRMHHNLRGQVIYRDDALYNGLAYENRFPEDNPNLRSDWFDFTSVKVSQEVYDNFQQWKYSVPVSLSQFMYVFVNHVRTLYCYKNVCRPIQQYLDGGLIASHCHQVLQLILAFKLVAMQRLDSVFGWDMFPDANSNRSRSVDKVNGEHTFQMLKALFRSVTAVTFVVFNVVAVEITARVISGIAYHAINITTILATTPQPIEIEILHMFLPSFLSRSSAPNVAIALLLVLVHLCRVNYKIKDLLNMLIKRLKTQGFRFAKTSSFSCPACRGKNRKHTRDTTCRYDGFTTAQMYGLKLPTPLFKILAVLPFGRISEVVSKIRTPATLQGFISIGIQLDCVYFGLASYCLFLLTMLLFETFLATLQRDVRFQSVVITCIH